MTTTREFDESPVRDPRGTGDILPRDQGQLVVRESWVTQDGCLIRTADRSEPPTEEWRLHRWLIHGGAYEPWNGYRGCSRRGRRITTEEAMRLLRRD